MYHRDTGIQSIFGAAEVYNRAVVLDRTLIRLMNTQQNLHECGFAGAIFSNQGADLATLQLKIDILQRVDARKSLAYPLHSQDRFGS